MNSEASILVTNDAKPEDMLDEEDSDSSPPERPTTLSLDSNHDSYEDPCASLNEESSVRRSVSNVEQSAKFRLRDISPSRLKERRKCRTRKKSDQDTKSISSPRKNVRSTPSSWLPVSFQQMFPSYKSKAEDFKRLFKDVPESERLITDYSCALQRDILVHGRLYVSQSWLCFYANIFGWETLATIDLKHVTSMTKEKTALVIPNAIQVWAETEKYFFTSFVSRDSTFRSLFLVWQNVSSEEPSSASDLMKAVGKYLDVDSDMETSSRGSNDEFPSELDDIIIGDGETESLVDSEEPHSIDSPKEPSIEKKADDIDKLAEESCNEPQPPEVTVSPASPLESKQDTTADKATSGPKASNGTIPRGPKSPGTPESRRRFPFPFKKDLSPLMRRRKHTKTKSIDNVTGTVHRDSLIEDGSVSDSNDEETGPVLCPCDCHHSLECINEEFAIDVDTVYEYLFTDCDFYRSLRSARKDFDLYIEPWAEVENKKRRLLKYTVNLNFTFGPKTSRTEEKQELEASEPGQYYVVESSITNEGIPYSESFVVCTRYCLTRVNEVMCRIRVTSYVKYIRPVWGFVKNMIGKNSVEGLSSFFEFMKDFIKEAEHENVKNRRRRLDSSRKRPRAIQNKLGATRSKSDEENERKAEPAAKPTAKVEGRISILARRIWRDNNWFLSFFTMLLILLLVLNVYLGYRVCSLERSTKPWESMSLPSLTSEWPTNIDEYRDLLYKQQYIQNLQFKRWQQVISTSMQFLQQVQESLKELQKEVEKPH